MDKVISDKTFRLGLATRLIAYGPLVTTALILIVQNYFSSWFQFLSIQIASAILAASVFFLIWHVESTLIKFAISTDCLKSKINELEKTQKNFITSTKVLYQTQLSSAFQTIALRTPRIGTLRIYAISSQQIMSFLSFSNIEVDKCQLLIRAFDENDTENRDFFQQIKLVVADWCRLKEQGRIKELEIRHYDFFPTEYECIFDRDHLLLGLYDSSPDDYSKVNVRNPILFCGTSEAGRTVISEFASRFDNLFETCREHHGNYCVTITKEKKQDD